MNEIFEMLDNYFITEHSLKEAVQELVSHGMSESDATKAVYEYTKHIEYVGFDEHP